MGTLIRALIYGEFDVYYRFEWPRGCTLRGLLFASWKYKKARTVVGTTPDISGSTSLWTSIWHNDH